VPRHRKIRWSSAVKMDAELRCGCTLILLFTEYVNSTLLEILESSAQHLIVFEYRTLAFGENKRSK